MWIKSCCTNLVPRLLPGNAMSWRLSLSHSRVLGRQNYFSGCDWRTVFTYGQLSAGGAWGAVRSTAGAMERGIFVL